MEGDIEFDVKIDPTSSSNGIDFPLRRLFICNFHVKE